MRRTVSAIACLSLLLFGAASRAAERPNIVFILADDLGWGDLACLNPDSKISTPHVDRLAREGRVFTDAHSGSSVCTPTRYGILTGRYAWRTRLKQGVLGGYSPYLIEPGRLTVSALLKQHGYATGGFGKWHLGFDWQTSPGTHFGDEVVPTADMRAVDYAKPFANGPITLGFDRYFGISASLDMPPYVFLRDDRATALPTAERTYIRTGPAAPDFEAESVLPVLVRETVAYLDERAREPMRPFFVYMPLNAPHTPVAPTVAFQGQSRLTPYADFVMQVDAAVGSVLEALDRNDQASNTLIIFTSDNGFSPYAGTEALLRRGHNPSGPFRGAKADLFEGGHRIPFVARWPGKVPAGTRCDATIGLFDLMATCAEIVGATLPPDAGEDSVSFLRDLLGTATGPAREALVHHSSNGSFAIRQGRWKLILCPDSGGWSEPRPGRDDTSKLPPIQLYDLEADRAEKRNVQAEHPEIVQRLTRLMRRYADEGRSTPGPRQRNDAPVLLERR